VRSSSIKQIANHFQESAVKNGAEMGHSISCMTHLNTPSKERTLHTDINYAAKHAMIVGEAIGMAKGRNSQRSIYLDAIVQTCVKKSDR